MMNFKQMSGEFTQDACFGSAKDRAWARPWPCCSVLNPNPDPDPNFNLTLMLRGDSAGEDQPQALCFLSVSSASRHYAMSCALAGCRLVQESLFMLPADAAHVNSPSFMLEILSDALRRCSS